MGNVYKIIYASRLYSSFFLFSTHKEMTDSEKIHAETLEDISQKSAVLSKNVHIENGEKYDEMMDKDSPLYKHMTKGLVR